MSRFFSDRFSGLSPYTPGEQPKEKNVIMTIMSDKKIRLPKTVEKYRAIIADWYEPGGEEFKYDVLLAEGWAFDFWRCDTECQQTEHFETIAQARDALRRAIKVDPVKNCSKCPHWNGSECIA